MELTLYLNTPGSSRQEIEPSEKLMVFPAPPPDDPWTYSSDDEACAEPDFTSRSLLV